MGEHGAALTFSMPDKLDNRNSFMSMLDKFFEKFGFGSTEFWENLDELLLLCVQYSYNFSYTPYATFLDGTTPTLLNGIVRERFEMDPKPWKTVRDLVVTTAQVTNYQAFVCKFLDAGFLLGKKLSESERAPLRQLVHEATQLRSFFRNESDSFVEEIASFICTKKAETCVKSALFPRQRAPK